MTLVHHLRYLAYLLGGTSGSSLSSRLDSDWWDDDYKRGGLARTEGDIELPRYLLIAGLVNQYAPGGSILDVGCGSGSLITPLRTCFASSPMRYVGIDHSASALQEARQRVDLLEGGASGTGTVELVQASFDEYHPSADCDAVVFSESLYYAPKPRQTVEQCTQTLSAGGIIVVSMWRRPSRWRIWSALRRDLREVSRSRVTVPRRPSWDIVVFARR